MLLCSLSRTRERCKRISRKDCGFLTRKWRKKQNGGKSFDSWAELCTRKLPIEVSDHKQLEHEANAMENTLFLASQELNFRKSFSLRLEKHFRQKLTKIPVCKHLVNYGMPIDIEERIKKNSDFVVVTQLSIFIASVFLGDSKEMFLQKPVRKPIVNYGCQLISKGVSTQLIICIASASFFFFLQSLFVGNPFSKLFNFLAKKLR